jgi:uncharacterized DUF497 family protein
MRIRFSKHATEKLDESVCKTLGISEDLIKKVLAKPEVIDSSDFPLLMAIGKLNKDLSLCIVYKFVETNIKVITFFPAKRGRYEGKILS